MLIWLPHLGHLRNKSWKPECALGFNMGWRILLFYLEPFWLPWIISILICLRVQIR